MHHLRKELDTDIIAANDYRYQRHARQKARGTLP
jgi:hypothetical protein